jgi:hypothetical protein
MNSFLSHDFGSDPAKQSPNCLFCLTPRAHASGECSTRLRSTLDALQYQFDVLKGEALALEAKIQCTCIQTHAIGCPAAPRKAEW